MIEQLNKQNEIKECLLEGPQITAYPLEVLGVGLFDKNKGLAGQTEGLLIDLGHLYVR